MRQVNVTCFKIGDMRLLCSHPHMTELQSNKTD